MIIIIDQLPSPPEVFECTNGVLPDSWSSIEQVGATIGGIPEPTLLQLLSPGIVFLHPHSHWSRLALKCRSLVPRPGEEEPWKKFVDVYAVQHALTRAGDLFDVRVQDYWATPDSYQEAFPDGLRGPSSGAHRSYTDSYLEGRTA